jgi:hypothetical protein
VRQPLPPLAPAPVARGSTRAAPACSRSPLPHPCLTSYWHAHSPLPPSSRRYEHALNKANYASLALRPEAASAEDEGGLDEDEDLYQSLSKWVFKKCVCVCVCLLRGRGTLVLFGKNRELRFS